MLRREFHQKIISSSNYQHCSEVLPSRVSKCWFVCKFDHDWFLSIKLYTYIACKAILRLGRSFLTWTFLRSSVHLNKWPLVLEFLFTQNILSRETMAHIQITTCRNTPTCFLHRIQFSTALRKYYRRQTIGTTVVGCSKSVLPELEVSSGRSVEVAAKAHRTAATPLAS